jgi:hypothetical protein
VLIAAAVVLVAAPSFAKKKQGAVSFVLKPNQTATLEGVVITKAAQDCENWLLAAALETALRAQGAPVDQHELVTKANGGELCSDLPDDVRDVVRAVADELPIGNGVSLKLKATLAPGAPQSVDTVLAGIVQKKPVILLWQGRAYVVGGAVYDEQDWPDGSRKYQINQLTLLDPAGGEPVVFDRAVHAMEDIEGMVTVSVTRIEAQTWSPAQPSWNP